MRRKKFFFRKLIEFGKLIVEKPSFLRKNLEERLKWENSAKFVA